MTIKEATDQLVRVCKESDAKKIIGLEKRLAEAKLKLEKKKNVEGELLRANIRANFYEKKLQELRGELRENM